MRKLLLVVVTLSLLSLLPPGASAQEGESWRVLEPSRYEFTLPDSPEPSDFWTLLLHEDQPPDLDVEPADTRPQSGPYLYETTFNPDNYSLTFELCGFTPEAPLEPVVTLPDGSRYNSAQTLSRLGLWPEPEALPTGDPDATCVFVVQQIGIGSYLDGDYTVSYVDPTAGVFEHTWSLAAPRFPTVVTGPRGLDYTESVQAAWLLLSFPPEATLRVAVYHRYDTTEPVEGQENPLGWFQFVGETEIDTDAYGEVVLVATVPEALYGTIDPLNLTLVIWSEAGGLWGHNYFPTPLVARVMVGEDRTLRLRQARQADAPELARLPNNQIIEIISIAGDQVRVRTLNGLEGWVYPDWLMPLYGVESDTDS